MNIKTMIWMPYVSISVDIFKYGCGIQAFIFIQDGIGAAKCSVKFLVSEGVSGV
jgi:hypothetical protein